MNDDSMPQWQLADLATQVGKLLGMQLDLSWPGPGVRIGTEGDGLYLSEPYDRRGRIEIHGWHPHTSYGFRGGERKHITVRADRGPGVIASEINARLLPVYRAVLAKIRDHDASERAAQQNRDALAAYITGLFPAKCSAMPGHCQDNHRSEVTLYLPGHQGGRVKFHGDGGEVEFERFRVPAAVALRMLEIAALLVPASDEEAA